jgi:REP element-mobilizing transposase RayT
MSTKYHFTNHDEIYFITATTVAWIDVFTRNIYKDILIDSFRYCQSQQGLRIHAWVVMTNHFHMMCSFDQGRNPGTVIKNIKSFTAIRIIDKIINNDRESRKNWMLDVFESKGMKNKSNYRFQFWQTENHPIIIDDVNKMRQRIDYIHENPVKAGFVSSPEEWVYGSGVDYYTANRKGLLRIDRL